MHLRSTGVVVAITATLLIVGACTSDPESKPKASASPGVTTTPFVERTTDAKTVLLAKGGASGGQTLTTALDAASRLFLQGACVGSGNVLITVSAHVGDQPGFSSVYTFACEPRERVISFPLGLFARGTSIKLTDDGSSGAGAYWAEIRKSS